MDGGQAVFSHGHADSDGVVVWLVPDFEVEAFVEVAQQLFGDGSEVCACEDR